MRKSARLPARFPIGTKYVLESRGPVVRRYVEFPGGQRINLEFRKALTCTCAATQQAASIVPDHDPEALNTTPFDRRILA
jgi:hypothetical protein